MYSIISSFKNSFDDIGLIYHIPNFLEKRIKTGCIVEIPFGNKIDIGIVLKIGKLDDFKININENKIKSIISIYNDNIFIDGYRLKLSQWIAKHYFSKIHHCINLFFPKNLRNKIEKNKIDLTKSTKKDYDINIKKSLNNNQKEVYNKILSSKKNILLHGITGSGKTEIYIQLIKDNLVLDKQSLLLVPEIILTNQLFERIKNVFGNNVISIHSGITDAKKTKYWIDIYNNNTKIIIGTRSSLFYPYNNLGLIIIDEEHDNSYISDKSPGYNTITVAEKITELNKNKLILGSGTPSINRVYNSINGNFELINLFNKYK